jgi:hypothetical protein
MPWTITLTICEYMCGGRWIFGLFNLQEYVVLVPGIPFVCVCVAFGIREGCMTAKVKRVDVQAPTKPSPPRSCIQMSFVLRRAEEADLNDWGKVAGLAFAFKGGDPDRFLKNHLADAEAAPSDIHVRWLISRFDLPKSRFS